MYSPDLVANINPPTTALLLVGIVHTALFTLLRPRLAQIAERPVPAAVTGFVSARAMTIYLWHMPALLAVAGLSAVAAMTTGLVLPAVGGAQWWLTRPLWLAAALGLTALIALPLARFETLPAPEFTDRARRLAVGIVLGVGAVALLLVVGTSPGTAVIAVALLVAAICLATATGVPARV